MKSFFSLSCIPVLFSMLTCDVAAQQELNQVELFQEIENNAETLSANPKAGSLRSLASFGKGAMQQSATVVETAFNWSLYGAGLYALFGLFDSKPVAAYVLAGWINGAIAGFGWGMFSGTVGSFFDLVDKDDRQERMQAFGRLSAILAAAGYGSYKIAQYIAKAG